MSKRYHYSYGSGSVGCLYDYGPNFTERLSDAVRSLDFVLCDELPALTRRRIRGALRRDGIYYFTRKQREIVGADYCEVTKQHGPCPDEEY